MLVLEDGEIVKMTVFGFVSTGMFVVDSTDALPLHSTSAGTPVEETA